MKIVVNECYGGFGLSHKAVLRYGELAGLNITWDVDKPEASLFTHYYAGNQSFSDYDIKRDDPLLVQVVEELGAKASGAFAELHITEIPDDVDWYIHDYDGMEHVAEQHRTW